MKKNAWILIKISLQFVSKGPIDNKSAGPAPEGLNYGDYLDVCKFCVWCCTLENESDKKMLYFAYWR